jgi:hypothetical protein
MPKALAASTESIMNTPGVSRVLVTITVMDRPFSRLNTSTAVFLANELQAA